MFRLCDEETRHRTVEATARHVGKVEVRIQLLLGVPALYLQFEEVLDARAQGGVANIRLIRPVLCHGSRVERVVVEQTRGLGWLF